MMRPFPKWENTSHFTFAVGIAFQEPHRLGVASPQLHAAVEVAGSFEGEQQRFVSACKGGPLLMLGGCFDVMAENTCPDCRYVALMEQ